VNTCYAAVTPLSIVLVPVLVPVMTVVVLVQAPTRLDGRHYPKTLPEHHYFPLCQVHHCRQTRPSTTAIACLHDKIHLCWCCVNGGDGVSGGGMMEWRRDGGIGKCSASMTEKYSDEGHLVRPRERISDILGTEVLVLVLVLVSAACSVHTLLLLLPLHPFMTGIRTQ